jgi:hypothetical protein
LTLLGDYGGQTQTFGLLFFSPALGAGSVALAVDSTGNPLTTDQRGLPRVVNGTVDIGAFEYQGAATITVDSTADTNARDGGLTLREALLLEVGVLGVGDLTPAERARVTGGDPGMGYGTDVIQFDANTFAVPRTIVLANFDLPELTHNMNINGPGAGLLTVDAHRASGILHVDPDLTVSLSGMTLANGNNGASGGAIENEHASLSLTACVLTGNSTFEFGGGIYNNVGTLTLTDCILNGNSATDSGGGILNSQGTVTLMDCTLTNNSAGGFGGGLSNLEGKIKLQGCTLYDNHAPNAGGGGIDNFGTATVTDCTFDSNTAFWGGAVWDSDTATLTGCTFTGNSASSEGGGIYIESAAAIANCTFSTNSAGLGGAVFVGNGTTGTLTNCTLAFNSVTTGGGGLYNDGGTVKLNNNIILGNTCNVPVPSDVQGFNVDPSSGYNLIGSGGSGGILDGANGNQIGVSVAAAGLAPLGNYGGPTPTFGLLPGSLALDRGSNALAVDSFGNPLTTDQRGMSRVVNGTVDIGAFEYQGPAIIIVNSTTDTNARDGVLTLREALLLEDAGLGVGDLTAAEQAQVIGGDPGMGNGTDSIDFDGSLFASPQTITLANGQLPAVVHNVTITGPGASNLTIDAHQASGIFQIDPGVSAALSGLTVANGYTSGSGGGIDNEAAALVLADCVLRGNSGQFAGGVLNNSGKVTLNDCTLVRNSAYFDAGGAVYNNFGTVIFTDCLLDHNSAAFYGGGVYNEFGTANFLGCTLTGNTAFQGGGLNSSGTASLTDCVLTDNSVAQFGGAVYSFGKVVLESCTLSGNTAFSGGGLDNDAGGMASLNGCTLSGNTVQYGGAGMSNNGTAGLTNCTISGNTANGFDTAAGIDTSSVNADVNTKLVNCTVANNTNLNASGPGGVFAGRYGTGQATVTLLNSIVANNSGAQFSTSGASVGPGTFTSLGYNLSSDASGNLVQTGDLQNTNPLLAPLGYYGGPTQTMALLPGSPAIDAGTTNTAPPTDQRGLGRVGAVDIGAFESQGFTLTIVAGNNQTTAFNKPLRTNLAVAVTANNPLEPVQGGLITFAAPTTGPGGSFPGGSSTATVSIGGNGLAVAPTFTVNQTIGTFTVTATSRGANTVRFLERIIPPTGNPFQPSHALCTTLSHEEIRSSAGASGTTTPAGEVPATHVNSLILGHDDPPTTATDDAATAAMDFIFASGHFADGGAIRVGIDDYLDILGRSLSDKPA